MFPLEWFNEIGSASDVVIFFEVFDTGGEIKRLLKVSSKILGTIFSERAVINEVVFFRCERIWFPCEEQIEVEGVI